MGGTQDSFQNYETQHNICFKKLLGPVYSPELRVLSEAILNRQGSTGVFFEDKAGFQLCLLVAPPTNMAKPLIWSFPQRLTLLMWEPSGPHSEELGGLQPTQFTLSYQGPLLEPKRLVSLLASCRPLTSPALLRWAVYRLLASLERSLGLLRSFQD